MILHFFEIYPFQVDASDVTIVHGPIVNHPVLSVGCHGKLGGTWHIGWSFSPCILTSGRDIEVVQNMECLNNTCFGIGLLWSRELEESGTDKSGRRGEVTRKSQ